MYSHLPPYMEITHCPNPQYYWLMYKEKAEAMSVHLMHIKIYISVFLLDQVIYVSNLTKLEKVRN